MSHLSILPTMLRDAVRLATSLEQLGLQPQQGGSLAGFGGERQAVLLGARASAGNDSPMGFWPWWAIFNG